MVDVAAGDAVVEAAVAAVAAGAETRASFYDAQPKRPLLRPVTLRR